MTREEAWKMLNDFNHEPFHLHHALVVEGLMRHFAMRQGVPAGEVEFWGVVGLLHDLDFEQFPKEHCLKEMAMLRERGAEEHLVHAVGSHGYGICCEVKPEHFMEKILFAVDELSGLIGATALMLPSRSVADLQLRTLLRKFRTPNFAAGCSREVIARGAEMLGWPLDNLLQKTLDAMQAVIPRLPKT